MLSALLVNMNCLGQQKSDPNVDFNAADT